MRLLGARILLMLLVGWAAQARATANFGWYFGFGTCD
jgi:hypothetical protein